jgi:mRNA interferase MazF
MAAPLRQGDIVLVPFPFADLSGRKVRPAVIISSDPQRSELTVALVTRLLTNRSPIGAEVELLGSDPEFGATGLNTDSLLRLDKLATLSQTHDLSSARDHRPCNQNENRRDAAPCI